MFKEELNFLINVKEKYVCFRRSGWRKKIVPGRLENFLFVIFKRLLSCFNPSLTLKNNCFLLIIFTTECEFFLLHSSVTVLRSKLDSINKKIVRNQILGLQRLID